MRSQQEILDRIYQIQKSGVDPSGIQQKVLIHKLSWSNAQQFLKEEDKTYEMKDQWNKKCILDKKFILKEIEEQIDYTYPLIADKDYLGVITSLQIIMIYLWLLSKDKILNILVPEILSSKDDTGKKAMRKLCEELGLNWSRYELRYLNDGSNIIIP